KKEEVPGRRPRLRAVRAPSSPAGRPRAVAARGSPTKHRRPRSPRATIVPTRGDETPPRVGREIETTKEEKKKPIARARSSPVCRRRSRAVAAQCPRAVAAHRSQAPFLPRGEKDRGDIIAVNDVICVRGYWNTPEDKEASKDHLLNWFNSRILKAGFFDLKDMLYFPQRSGKMLYFSLKKVKEP
ncbi:hypothetical protein GW17_00053854, partial [Ensete ventricosum]